MLACFQYFSTRPSVYAKFFYSFQAPFLQEALKPETLPPDGTVRTRDPLIALGMGSLQSPVTAARPAETAGDNQKKPPGPATELKKKNPKNTGRTRMKLLVSFLRICENQFLFYFLQWVYTTIILTLSTDLIPYGLYCSSQYLQVTHRQSFLRRQRVRLIKAPTYPSCLPEV